MQRRRQAPMFSDVTAVALGRPSGRPVRGAVAPASATASLRRLTGTLHEPNAWTAGIVVATGLVLIARHPIARALGTEVDPTPPTAAASAPAVIHAPAAPPAAVAGGLVAVVPTHAPRDPFRALVTQGGKVLAPAAVAAKPTAKPAPATPATPATVPTSSSGCNGTSHRIASGDTLWTLAARAVHSSDSGRVTIAWHRLYAANRDTVGSNPSLLPVGATLCVPTSL